MKTEKLGKRVVNLCAKYAKAETAIQYCNKDPEMMEAVSKHYNRAILAGKKTSTVRQWLDDRITTRLYHIAMNMPDEGYSMGSVIRVQMGRLVGVHDRTQKYANSCRWRATYGCVEVKLTPEEFRNIRCDGGLVTCIYPNQKDKVKKCWWYAGKGQKQHFELLKVGGYIYAGYHSTSKVMALEGGTANLEQQKQAKAQKLLSEKEKKAVERKMAIATRQQYDYADSIAVNCEPGTKAFILRCGLDKNKRYRGSFLLKVATEKSTYSIPYIQRMIKYRASKMINR